MSDSDTDSDLNPEPQPQSGLNQTNCREFLFVIEDVPSRIAHGETFYTPIQGFPRLLAFVDFGGENVVRCGLKYIGKGQVKPLYQFIVHPFETTPLDMALDRWHIGQICGNFAWMERWSFVEQWPKYHVWMYVHCYYYVIILQYMYCLCSWFSLVD